MSPRSILFDRKKSSQGNIYGASPSFILRLEINPFQSSAGVLLKFEVEPFQFIYDHLVSKEVFDFLDLPTDPYSSEKIGRLTGVQRSLNKKTSQMIRKYFGSNNVTFFYFIFFLFFFLFFFTYIFMIRRKKQKNKNKIKK